MVACVVAAVAASAGFVAARRARGARGRASEASATTRDGRPARRRGDPLDGAAAREPVDPFVGLPLALGDVVCVEHEERWLAGALVVRDRGRVIAAVFLAPEGAITHAVAAFSPPARAVWWLAPVRVASPPDPPATIEIGGVALRRRGRLPVEIERLGQGAPALGASALFATYEGAGRDVAVLFTEGDRVHAWSGVRWDEGEYERLGPGGEP
jgi:hypothetical protein